MKRYELFRGSNGYTVRDVLSGRIMAFFRDLAQARQYIQRLRSVSA